LLTHDNSSGIYVDPYKLSNNGTQFRTVTKASFREFGAAFANCKCRIIILSDGSFVYRNMNNKKINMLARLTPYKCKTARDSTRFGLLILETLRESIATGEHLDMSNLEFNIRHKFHKSSLYFTRLGWESPFDRFDPLRIVPLPATGTLLRCDEASGSASIEEEEEDILEHNGTDCRTQCGCDSDDDDDGNGYPFADLLPIDIDQYSIVDEDEDDEPEGDGNEGDDDEDEDMVIVEANTDDDEYDMLPPGMDDDDEDDANI